MYLSVTPLSKTGDDFIFGYQCILKTIRKYVMIYAFWYIICHPPWKPSKDILCDIELFFAYCLHDMHQSRNWQNHKILSMHKKKELLPSTLMSKKCLSVTLFCLRGYKNNFATFFFSRECFHHWYDVPENHETESGVCVSNWWNFIYVGLVSSNTKDNQWKQVKISFKVPITYCVTTI